MRTSTDKQDLNNQKLEILEYAWQNDLRIDDFIAISMSSRKHPQERRIDELFACLNPGDRLLVTELSRLGHSTGEVIHLRDELVKQGIGIIVIKQNLTLDQTHNDLAGAFCLSPVVGKINIKVLSIDIKRKALSRKRVRLFVFTHFV